MKSMRKATALAGLITSLTLGSSAMALTGTERQVTTDANGHILTNLHVFSPDSEWIVYDERSDREGAKFDSASIKRVNVRTGAIETLYTASNGAFVGVVTYNPKNNVVFIHGPENPTPQWSYAGEHRAGTIVDVAKPGVAINLDARDITAPFTPGALRGGSHVHMYEPNGEWLSFTYQDSVMAVLGKTGDHDLDQRNVGVSVPGHPVTVGKDNPRNRDGTTFTFLATHTVNAPKPGSDEVNRAYEEGWVGSQGYVKADGSRQRHAIAFLGDTMTAAGKPLTEVFIADLPEDVTHSAPNAPIEGTATRLPAPPQGVTQRRLTFTGDRKFPGIQGPRFWVRTNASGDRLAFLMKDDSGVVQIYTVSPNGGAISQLTKNSFSVNSTLGWSPDGKRIAYAGNDSVYVTDASSGVTTQVAPQDASRPVLFLAADFSPSGKSIAYVRVIKTGGVDRNQIFVTDLSE